MLQDELREHKRWQLELAQSLCDTGQTEIDTICRTRDSSSTTLYRTLKDRFHAQPWVMSDDPSV
jgi:hypothetical protein